MRECSEEESVWSAPILVRECYKEESVSSGGIYIDPPGAETAGAE